MTLASLCSDDSFIKTGGGGLKSFADIRGVNTPRDNGLMIRLDDEKVINVGAFGQEHQVGIRQCDDKRNEFSGEISYMVQSKAIKHFAHIEVNAVRCSGSSSGNLTEHSLVVDIQLDIRRVLSIDECEITICTIVRAAIGKWGQLMVWATPNIQAKPAIEMSDERSCSSYHQSFLPCTRAWPIEIFCGDGYLW